MSKSRNSIVEVKDGKLKESNFEKPIIETYDSNRLKVNKEFVNKSHVLLKLKSKKNQRKRNKIKIETLTTITDAQKDVILAFKASVRDDLSSWKEKGYVTKQHYIDNEEKSEVTDSSINSSLLNDGSLVTGSIIENAIKTSDQSQR